VTLLASVEERFLVPAYASRLAEAWIATHGALALPFQLRGEVRRSVVATEGGSLRVLEIGRKKHLTPFRQKLLGPVTQEHDDGTLTLTSPAALDAVSADLTLVEIHRWMAPRFRRAGWIVVPADVRWQGDLSNLPPRRPTVSLKSDLAKVRRHDYTLEHATDSGDWDEFYHGMVVPQARARFGDDVWIPSERLQRVLSVRGRLHFIRRGGVRVAGVCSVRDGASLWLPLMGLRQGDQSLLREGVYSAAFSLVFAWAREMGCQRVDMGRTSPFVHDGIQRFKRKWGLQPAADPLSHLIAVRAGQSVRPMFERQPVLIETARGIATYPEAA
jgi:hypothetical protein